MKGSSPAGKVLGNRVTANGAEEESVSQSRRMGRPESASKLVGTGAAQPRRASLPRPIEPCVGTNPRKAQCWETWLC